MADTASISPLLTVTDVAAILRLSRSQTYDWIHRQGIGIKVGERGLRVREEDLRRWLADQEQG
jgi:excisionase family DNA binding protein